MNRLGWIVCLALIAVGLHPQSASSLSLVYLDDNGNRIDHPKDFKSILRPDRPLWWSDKKWSEMTEEPAEGGSWSVVLWSDNEIKSRGPEITFTAKSSETTITIVNADGAGEGFNDPTAATPVGGNSGTTIGQQRQIAFQFAADIWANLIVSTVEIKVNAKFDPLTCNASSATLGSAGPAQVFRDFSGAPFSNTWYHVALANSIAGSDLSPSNPDINATFNSSIDNNDNCLAGQNWYYGLDMNPPGSDNDFVAVLLHEMGHGLGFSTFVDKTTGAKFNGYDDVYMKYLEDHSLGLAWSAMSNGQRATSAVDTGDLHFTGTNVVSDSTGLSSGRHASGHVEMFAPNPIQGGSSISHFSTSVFPNELMEPYYTGPNHDPNLAVSLFQDLGWTLASAVTPTPSNTWTPSHTPTVTNTPTDTNTPTNTPTPTPPGEICVAVGVPSNGQRVDGNRVTVKADIDTPLGNLAHVRFQYRISPSGSWTDVGSQDADFPYYEHWDVSALVDEQAYDLRSIAQNTLGVDCGSASVVTVIVDHDSGTRDIYENLSGDDHRKSQQVSSSSTNQIVAGDEDSGFAVQLTIPSGAITTDDTMNIEFKDNGDFTAGHLDDYDNLNGFFDLSLDSASLSGNITVRFEYEDQDNNGILDGTSIPEDALQIYHLDTGMNRWRPLNNRTIDKQENTIEAITNQLGSFSILGGIESSRISDLRWNMIGFPGITHETTPTDIFGDEATDPNNHVVNLWEYDEPTGGWTKDVPSLTPGRGYIVFTRSSVSLDGYGSKVYDANTVVNLDYTSSQPLAGFQMIGNPYTAAVGWDDITLNNVADVYYFWDGSQYLFYVGGGGGGSTASGNIGIFEAVWVEANGASPSVTIPRPGGAKQTEPEPNPAFEPSLEDWRFQIAATSGELIDSYNYAGISPQSIDGLDPFDVKDLGNLQLEESISLVFPHPEWSEAAFPDFAQDVRSSTSEDLHWEFTATSNPVGKTIDLAWPNVGLIHDAWRFVVIDRETGAKMNPRNGEVYSFVSGTSPRVFDLYAAINRTEDEERDPVINHPIPGDLDGDEAANGIDLFLFASHWLNGKSIGDRDGNEQTEAADLLQLLQIWIDERE